MPVFSRSQCRDATQRGVSSEVAKSCARCQQRPIASRSLPQGGRGADEKTARKDREEKTASGTKDGRSPAPGVLHPAGQTRQTRSRGGNSTLAVGGPRTFWFSSASKPCCRKGPPAAHSASHLANKNMTSSTRSTVDGKKKYALPGRDSRA